MAAATTTPKSKATPRGPTPKSKAYIDSLFQRLCNLPRLASVDDDGWVHATELASTQKEKQPSTIKKLLLADTRFEYQDDKTKRIRLTDPNLRLVAWKPKHSIHPPPAGVWEALFLACDTTVIPALLPQWRWLHLLPLVCRKFRELMRPDAMMFLQCENDHEPLLCKKELTRIFGIQPNQYDELTFKIIYHARHDRQTHLAWRKDVLQLAVKKHYTIGETSFRSIADAYNARMARKANMAKGRSQREQKAREMRVQRRRDLERMLAAENIPPIGFYFGRCVDGEEPDMAEFRFRHYIATTGAEEYERIVDQLAEDEGYYYAGIHSDARGQYSQKLAKRGVSFDKPLH